MNKEFHKTSEVFFSEKDLHASFTTSVGVKFITAALMQNVIVLLFFHSHCVCMCRKPNYHVIFSSLY